MAKRGRKPYQKDDDTGRQVELLAGLGIKQEDIAEVLKMSESNLKKYYQEELSKGAPRANARVARHLFKLATNDKNPTAAIFWLKCRSGWRDHQVIEHVGKDGKDLVPSINVTIRKS